MQLQTLEVHGIISITKDSQRQLQVQGDFGSSSYSVANTTLVTSDTSTTVQCSMCTSQVR